MEPNPKLLLDTLDDLKSEELERFQWYLSTDNALEDFPHIRKGQLEKASTCDTVDKMLDNYGYHEAVTVTMKILIEMERKPLAEKLHKLSEGSLNRKVKNSMKQKLQKNLKQKFSLIQEGASMRDEAKHIRSVYTELSIVKGFIGRKHKVSMNRNAAQKHVEEDTPITFNEIFKCSHHQDNMMRKVLTLGLAGVGKTMSVKKFILDWVEGSQDMDYVFPLMFRKLNSKIGQKLSIVGLLDWCFPETKSARTLICEGSRVMFILDGLDEGLLPLNFGKNDIVTDIEKEATLDSLITSLIMGELLPSAYVWITSRPAAANRIPPSYIHLVTEVKGFTDAHKEEYFRKTISDAVMASRIITHLKKSRTFFTLCHIPVFCYVSSTVLTRALDNLDQEAIPQTMTEMYSRFLLYQAEIIKEKYQKEPTQILDLKKIGRLAFCQLQKGLLSFCETDLSKSGVKASDVAMYSGIVTQDLEEDENAYSFVHLSFQEFLAAVYVFITFMTKKTNPLLQSSWQKLKWTFHRNVLNLHKTAIIRALQSDSRHDLFLPFLFGLSLESNQVCLKKVWPQMKVRGKSLKSTVDYIKKKLNEKISTDTSISLLHCLSELRDHSLVSEVQSCLRSGDSAVKFSSAQWSALVFLLLMTEETEERFDLKKYRRSEEGLRRLLPVIKNTKQALLDHCHLTENICKELGSSCLDSQVRKLDLSSNNLQDSGVKLLCDELVNSHLESLSLKCCNMNNEGCEALASVLPSCSALKELDLSYNNLQDSEVGLLCKGLENPDSNLEILRLVGCFLTGEGCSFITSALSHACLKELDLSYNHLGNSGVMSISAGLRSPHCILEILKMRYCNIMMNGCEALASSVCPLRELDLSYNELHDSGVKLLCDGLQNSQSKLEILRVSRCFITEEGCSFLASTLSSSPSYLRELDLSYNHSGDSGVKMLTDGFKSPHCNLEILKLRFCGVTSKGCEAVASVFSCDSTLRELDLSINDLQDSGVKLLADGLKSLHCKVEILRLSGCLITEEGCSMLASAFRLNPSNLRELDLSYNNPGGGAKLLLSTMSNSKMKLSVDNGGLCRITSGLKKYSCDLTLNPNSAHKCLALSNGNKKVTRTKMTQPYSRHPDRFESWDPQILCQENLSGRCYWEIEWMGTVTIAVTYRGITRKGKSVDCSFGSTRMSWCLDCNESGYSTWHNNKRTAIPVTSSSNRVGVYLDWFAGTLSFYTVCSDTQKLSHVYTYHTAFTEPLYAGFALYYSDSSVSLYQLVSPRSKHTPLSRNARLV